MFAFIDIFTLGGKPDVGFCKKHSWTAIKKITTSHNSTVANWSSDTTFALKKQKEHEYGYIEMFVE